MENIIITTIVIIWLIAETVYLFYHSIAFKNYKQRQLLEKYSTNSVVDWKPKFVMQTGIATENINEHQLVTIRDGKAYAYKDDEEYKIDNAMRKTINDAFKDSNVTKIDDIDYNNKQTNSNITYDQFELVYEYLENEQLLSSLITSDIKSEYERFINKNYTNE